MGLIVLIQVGGTCSPIHICMDLGVSGARHPSLSIYLSICRVADPRNFCLLFLVILRVGWLGFFRSLGLEDFPQLLAGYV